ncbi:Glucuronoxylan 4-O-methyltransferase 1 [Vitis vinifera]|uniref:Glucuronoxylan 4-O-methyltransferase 1 n=1 Tax=Vitis vinifera TaxID=29760 RepID=A0A438GZZ6_VITVI|nr:Glucuronoxylan 4-O-methyltransferase 1 [Vitis vinifera]
MRPKSQALNLRLLLLGIFFAFFLLFALRSSLSSPQEDLSPISPTSLPKVSNTIKEGKAANCSPTCTKIPTSLAQALIHYTTSTITPQQTLKEISVTSKILVNKSPCNFLVFGLGHDSLMWRELNHGGRTIFLEEDEAWIEQIRQRFPKLESYHVMYDSKVNQADNLMEVGKGPECIGVGDIRHSTCQLALKGLPNEVYDIKWDLIMVDAPTGYYEEAPGRMAAIYTAGMMARNRKDGETDVFVHDVNRVVEDKFSRAFLCDGYMRKQTGRLRHFRIPSHRDGSAKPFCPLSSMTLPGSFQIKKPDVIPVHCKSKGNMTRKNRMSLEQFNQTGTVPFLDAMCLSKGTHTVCKE